MPSLLLLSCRSADLIQALQHAQIFHNPSKFSRKRKRGQEEQDAGGIALLQPNASFLRRDYEPSIPAVLLKGNYIRRRWLTSARAALNLSNIGFRRGNFATSYSWTVSPLADLGTDLSETKRSSAAPRHPSASVHTFPGDVQVWVWLDDQRSLVPGMRVCPLQTASVPQRGLLIEISSRSPVKHVEACRSANHQRSRGLDRCRGWS